MASLQKHLCQVNLTAVELPETPETLLEWLRDSAGQVDVRHGCDTGQCGACAVFVDNVPVKACSMLAYDLEHSHIVTPAALHLLNDNATTALLAAFHEHQPFQCGYCAPAFLAAAIHLLRTISTPTEQEVRNAFAGLLCRCTGYQSIIDTVLAAARAESAAKGGAPDHDPSDKE